MTASCIPGHRVDSRAQNKSYNILRARYVGFRTGFNGTAFITVIEICDILNVNKLHIRICWNTVWSSYAWLYVQCKWSEWFRCHLHFMYTRLLQLRRNSFWSWLQIRLNLVTRNEVYKSFEKIKYWSRRLGCPDCTKNIPALPKTFEVRPWNANIKIIYILMRNDYYACDIHEANGES